MTGRRQLRVPGRQRGTATLELALLVPILFLLFAGVVQLVIFLESSIAAQYAAFTAARAYQVYGTRTLESIGSKRLRSAPLTNAEQTIAEAAAEKVIFESLGWEYRNLEVAGGAYSFERAYRDGNDLSVNHVSSAPATGSVLLNVLAGQGVEVTYCMPIWSPVGGLFDRVRKEAPCSPSRPGKSFHGVAITKAAGFGVEPEVKP
jgi:Flp pilus assembly protein TadG